MLLVPAGAAGRTRWHARIVSSSTAQVLRSGKLRVAVTGVPRHHVRLAAHIGAHGTALTRPRKPRLDRRGRASVSLPLLAAARKQLRVALVHCRASSVTLTAVARGGRARAARKLSGGHGCGSTRPPSGGGHPGNPPPTFSAGA